MLNHLHIKKDEEFLLTLTNYHFYLENQTNHNDNNNTQTKNNLNDTQQNNNTNPLAPYILNTTLKQDKFYSTLGIELCIPKEKDTFSNEGNFSIHINNTSLKNIEYDSNHCITKDTPIFCYVQENKQNFIAKFKDNQSTINFTLDTTIQKDEDNNIIPIETKNIFISFIPFKDNTEANHTNSQKLQLTSEDLNKVYKDINFKLPLLYLKDCEMFRGWREEVKGEEVKEQYYIDDEGYLQGIKIIKYPITRLEFTQSNGFQPKAIVLHRTDSSTAKSTLEYWNNPNNARFGTHFLIDTDGTIYQCASLYKYTQHMGDIKVKNLDINDKNYKNKSYQQASSLEKEKQYPDRYSINTDGIGIEVVGKCFNTMEKKVKIASNYTQYSGKWQEITGEQKDSIKILIDILKTIYNMNNDDIYGHGEVSAHRTSNEGEGLYEK